MDENQNPWALESGLPNDVDAWMVRCHFGKKEDYATAVVADDETAGTQFLFDLVDENGEIIGENQGYSVGTGWIVSDDGLSISHPRRKNVVRGSRYGDLQSRVVEKLKVPMNEHGLPTDAVSWEGMGFHWMREDLKAVSGKMSSVALPSLFLGKKDNIKPVASTVRREELAISPELETKLASLAKANPVKVFQLQAMKIPEAVTNTELMTQILNEGPDGFWSKHQA